MGCEADDVLGGVRSPVGMCRGTYNGLHAAPSMFSLLSIEIPMLVYSSIHKILK